MPTNCSMRSVREFAVLNATYDVSFLYALASLRDLKELPT